MSRRTPKVSLVCMLPLIARTSVWLSDNIVMWSYPFVAASMRADRRARASAINGEVTKSTERDPERCSPEIGPVKVHASPAFFVILSQAASVLHPILLSGSSLRRLPSIGCSGGLVLRSLSWLIPLHSLAKLNPLVATSTADWLLFSKIRRLRSLQIAHRIHGSTLKVIPDGGRQITFRKLGIS